MSAVCGWRTTGRVLSVLAAVALCGCEALAPRPKVEVVTPTFAVPAPMATSPQAINSGSIFQQAQYRPLFEDYRARLVGDTITISIVEAVAASQEGTITATVTGVLANGHLLISGEKQIGVNDNVDVLRFSGQVDPRTIQQGNIVQSGQIANVRLENRGRGAQADSQLIGWLARFFLSVLPI